MIFQNFLRFAKRTVGATVAGGGGIFALSRWWKANQKSAVSGDEMEHLGNIHMGHIGGWRKYPQENYRVLRDAKPRFRHWIRDFGFKSIFQNFKIAFSYSAGNSFRDKKNWNQRYWKPQNLFFRAKILIFFQQNLEFALGLTKDITPQAHAAKMRTGVTKDIHSGSTRDINAFSAGKRDTREVFNGFGVAEHEFEPRKPTRKLGTFT